MLSTKFQFSYSNIGFTILLKSSSWHSIDKLCVLPLFKTSNIAFVAFSACFLIVLLKFPVLLNNILLFSFDIHLTLIDCYLASRDQYFSNIHDKNMSVNNTKCR